jgi:hypothetical protein
MVMVPGPFAVVSKWELATDTVVMRASVAPRTVIAARSRTFPVVAVEVDFVLTMVFRLLIDIARSLLSARSSLAETLPAGLPGIVVAGTITPVAVSAIDGA